LIGDIVLESTLKEAQLKAEELKLQLRSASDRYNEKFNIYWGQLFKAGHHDSQFAKQVRLSLYACSFGTYHHDCTVYIIISMTLSTLNIIITINTANINMQIRSDCTLVFIQVE
jgi:hypothetical protein